MRISKWAAVALTMTLLTSAAPLVAQAEAGVTQTGALTQEQAMEIVLKNFTIPEAYKLESASNGTNNMGPGSDPVWTFSWRNDEFADHSSINIVLQANTGEILSYNLYDNGAKPADKPIAYVEAQQKANALVQKLAPDKAKKIGDMSVPPASDNGNPNDQNIYSVRYQRMVNGIAVNGDGFNVVYDQAGNLREYAMNWSGSDEQFPKPDGRIDQDKAYAAYEAALPLELQYIQRFLPATKTPEIRLGYTVRNSQIDYSFSNLPILDAQTGKLITMTGDELKPGSPYQTLEGKPGTPPTAKVLDKDAALQLAKRYLPRLDDTYVLQNSEVTTGKDGSKSWGLNWRKGQNQEKGISTEIRLMMNATTGEAQVMSQWTSGDNGQKAQNVSWEAAQKIATDYVKTAIPTQIMNIVPLDSEPPADLEDLKQMPGNPGYSFSFGHLVNGILTQDHVEVQVDPASGDVIQFSDNFGFQGSAATSYPDPSNVVSLDAARKAYADKFPLDLRYVRLSSAPVSVKQPSAPGKFVLAYVPKKDGDALRLDALSGDWFSIYGTAGHKKVSDIAGHWAEKQLQQLADREILGLDSDGKVRPDEAVSRGDAMRIMVMFLSSQRAGAKSASYQDVAPTDPNYEFIETAVMLGWLPRDLKEFHPNEPIKREYLAELVTNVLGYGSLAKKQNVFLKPFDDLTAQDDAYLGSIAIAKALGMMAGDGERFAPQAAVSRAELAVVVSKLTDEMKNRSIMY